MADTEDIRPAEGLASVSLEDIAAEVKRRRVDKGDVYKAFGLKSPAEVTLIDFEGSQIAEHAEILGCLPPPDMWTRDTALRCLRDAAEHVAPAMDAVDRNSLLCDFDLITELERIEALLATGRTSAALEALRRFIRPEWMAARESAV